MGGAISSNIGSETVKELIQNSNSALQGCAFTVSEIQNSTISGNTGGTFNLTENLTQSLVLQNSCVQEVSTENNIQATIAQKVSQLAKSIAQQFGLSSAIASNLAEELAQLGVQVSNSFVQNCSTSASEIQNLNIDNNTDVTVNIYQNWDQYNVSTINCVMQDQAVNSTITNIDQLTEQQATATVQNFLAGILAAIFGIIALIVLVFFGLIFFGFILTHGGGKGTTEVTIAPAQEPQ